MPQARSLNSSHQPSLQTQEYVERTLTQDLRKYSRGFPPALAKMIAWQLLQAVSFLHKRKVRLPHTHSSPYEGLSIRHYMSAIMKDDDVDHHCLQQQQT